MINLFESTASNVFKNFDNISKIPRCSGNEKNISNFIKNFGISLGLETKQDEFLNVLIVKPATKGYENHDSVVLQGHFDMVCEKTVDSFHNFCTDPIKTIVEGDFVRADKTTLGADNGLGISMAMSILEDNTVEHPRLECIFTATEETGMDGAIGLSPKWLTGKKLLNIDTEDDDIIIVGCAGGLTGTVKLDVVREEVPNLLNYKLNISGLKGGHSGLMIGELHLNGIKLLNEVVMKLSNSNDVHIQKVSGGTKHNAIPTQAEYIVGINPENVEKFIKEFKTIKNEIKETYIKREPDVELEIKEISSDNLYYTKDISKNYLRLIQLFPHGVNKMTENSDLVQSSNSLAIVSEQDDKITILTSLRSYAKLDMEEMVKNINAIVESQNTTVEFGEGYPMWQPDFNSDLLNLVKETYKEMRGEDVKVSTIHAGLETGILSEKYPKMSMISMGPNIRGAHTPEEKFSISSTEFIYELLKNILKKL